MRGILSFLLTCIGIAGVLLYFYPGFHWYTVIGFFLQWLILVPAYISWYSIFEPKTK